MRLICENLATQRLAFKERDPETGNVVRVAQVDFDEAGRGEVDAEVGRTFVERYDGVREAEGPDDAAADFEPPDDVDATPEAREIADEHGIALDDVDGTGEDGRILKGDVEAAVEAGREDDDEA